MGLKMAGSGFHHDGWTMEAEGEGEEEGDGEGDGKGNSDRDGDNEGSIYMGGGGWGSLLCHPKIRIGLQHPN